MCSVAEGACCPAVLQVVVNYVAMTKDVKTGKLRVFDSSLEKGAPYDIRWGAGRGTAAGHCGAATGWAAQPSLACAPALQCPPPAAGKGPPDICWGTVSTDIWWYLSTLARALLPASCSPAEGHSISAASEQA
jgi:hypothetical protein